MKFRVVVYAGPPDHTDAREASMKVYDTRQDGPVEEILRKIGLEYKTADYMPTRTQTVITIDPLPNDSIEGVVLAKAAEMVDDLKEWLEDSR